MVTAETLTKQQVKLQRIVAAINKSTAGLAQPRGLTARPERIQIRCTVAERMRYQAAAAVAGRTLSDWARMLFDGASRP